MKPSRILLLLGAASLLMAPACLRAPASSTDSPTRAPATAMESPPLPEGSYQVQSIAYDDASGVYRVLILDPPAGHKPMFQTAALRMARLSDEAIAAGEKSQLKVDAEGPVAVLTPDFQIAFVHNVTEERADLFTGEREVVVVGQQQSFWSPFMAGMTGAMVGNMLFQPRYYYPPPYVGGGVLSGSGGVGATRALASQDFQSRHGSPPKAVRLSQSGYKKAPASGIKPSGSGVGSSRLRTGTPSGQRPKMGFGGGRRGFGRR